MLERYSRYRRMHWGRRAAVNTLMHTRCGVEFNVDATGPQTH